MRASAPAALLAALAAAAASLPLGADASCSWSSCKIGGAVWGGCSSGYAEVEEHGCACAWGICAGTSHKCCDCDVYPNLSGCDECGFFDVSCNWAVISADIFPNGVSDAIKDKYASLEENVREALFDAQEFTALTAAELREAGADLLAELETTAAMTASQLASITDVIHDMSVAQLGVVFGRLSPDAIRGALAALVSNEQWAGGAREALINSVVTRLGGVGSLLGDDLKALADGDMLAEAVQDALDDISGSAFAAARESLLSAKEWSGAQVQDLAAAATRAYGAVETWTAAEVADVHELLGGLTSGELQVIRIEFLVALDDEAFIDIDWTIDPNVFLDGLERFGEQAVWSAAQAAHLVSAFKVAAGDAAGWTAAQLNDLGELAASLPIDDLREISLDVLAATSGVLDKLDVTSLEAIAVRLPALADDKLEAVLAQLADVDAKFDAVLAKLGAGLGAGVSWAADQAAVIIDAAKAQYGPARDWTTAQLDNLGELVAQLPLDDLRDISLDALAAAGVYAQFGIDQLEALADRFGPLAADKLEALLAQLPIGDGKFDAVLAKLGAGLGAGVSWAADQAAVIIDAAKAQYGPARDWTTAQLDNLGELVAQLPLDDLRDISLDALAAAGVYAQFGIDQLEALADRFGPLAADKLEALLAQLPIGDGKFDAVLAKLGAGLGAGVSWAADQAAVIIDAAKAQYGPARDWTTAQLDNLGELVAQLPLDDLRDISLDALAAAGVYAQFGIDQLEALADRFGPLAADKLEALLAQLPIGDGKFDAVLAKLGAGLGAGVSWAADQAAVIIDAAKAQYGPARDWTTAQLDNLGELVAQFPVDDLLDISLEALAVAVSAAHLTAEQLGALASGALQLAVPQLEQLLAHVSSEAFAAAVSVWGQAGEWSAAAAAVVIARAKTAFGEVSSWTVSAAISLADFIPELTVEDVRELALDALAEARIAAKLTGVQLAALADRTAEFAQGPLLDFLASTTDTAFEAALSSLGAIRTYSLPKLRLLADRAKVALGDVSTWTVETVRDCGEILAGLEIPDMPKLTVEASVSVEPRAIERMSPQHTGNLDASQVGAMPTDTKKRFHGDRLASMDTQSRQAATCYDGPCPGVVVDFTLEGNAESVEATRVSVASQTGVDVDSIEVLYATTSEEGAAPSRRLFNDGGEALLAMRFSSRTGDEASDFARSVEDTAVSAPGGEGGAGLNLTVSSVMAALRDAYGDAAAAAFAQWSDAEELGAGDSISEAHFAAFVDAQSGDDEGKGGGGGKGTAVAISLSVIAVAAMAGVAGYRWHSKYRRARSDTHLLNVGDTSLPLKRGGGLSVAMLHGNGEGEGTTINPLLTIGRGPPSTP